MVIRSADYGLPVAGFRRCAQIFCGKRCTAAQIAEEIAIKIVGLVKLVRNNDVRDVVQEIVFFKTQVIRLEIRRERVQFKTCLLYTSLHSVPPALWQL